MATITAKADKAELSIYDEITTSSVREVDAALKSFRPDAAVTVFINSPGGDVFAGTAIYSMFQRRNVTIVVDGIAASAASFVTMAAKKIVMAPKSMMMVHDPKALTSGDSAAMASMVKLLESVKDQMSRAYSERSGQTIDTVLEMMALETWMTAEEAVAFGFADAVEGEVSIAASKALAGFDLSIYQHAPAAKTMAELAANYWGSRGKPTTPPPSDHVPPREFAPAK